MDRSSVCGDCAEAVHRAENDKGNGGPESADVLLPQVDSEARLIGGKGGTRTLDPGIIRVIDGNQTLTFVNIGVAPVATSN
jgi:hypothetical protein